MARVSKLRRHVAICRRGNILKTFVMKMGESSFITKALICRRILKNNSLLKKLRCPRKKGRRRSTEWFDRDFKDMPEAEFVANFRFSRAAVLKLCQEIGPHIKKEETFEKNTISVDR